MSPSRAIKALALALGGLVTLVVVAVLVASVVLQGPRLGSMIEKSLPANQGKLEIGGVTWSLRALMDLVTDAPSPISLDGLRIIDPEGTIVLDVPHLDARVKLRTLIGGSFSIHDLKVGKATWRFAAMKQSPAIGFLAALAPKNPSPPVAPTGDAKKEPQGPGSFFQIVNGDLDDLNAVFDFPGAWGLELRHVRTSASLIQSAVNPKHPIFGFDVGPLVAEGGGWLRIMDDNLLPFDKVVINRVSTTQDRPDDIFLDLREAKTGRSSLVGKGYFTGIYGATSVPGIDLHAEFHDAADAFGAVIAGKKIEGLVLSGDGASAVLDLHEPFATLKVSARFAGLDVAYAPYRALGVGFELHFDGGAMKVTVRDLTMGAPGGGRLSLDAALDAKTLKLAADLKLDHFTTDSYLPVSAQPLAGGQIAGHLHADVALGPPAPAIAVRDLDLRLDRRRAGGLPQAIRVHGAGAFSPARARTSGLTVEVVGARATASGEMDLSRRTVAAGIEIVAFDLARLLAALGLPRLGQRAQVSAKVSGPVASPTASGSASVQGLGVGNRVVPELRASFGLDHGVARLDALSGDALGGHVDGRGTLRLYEKSTRHLLKAPILEADLTLRNIDLQAATGDDTVTGRLSLAAHAEGPIDALTAHVRVPGQQPIVVAGQSVLVGPVELDYAKQAVTIKRLHAALRNGGTVDVAGTAALDGDVALDVQLRKIPLGEIPGVAEAGLGIAGIAAADLHLGGTLKRPLVSGVVSLSGVRARGIALGNGQITITPDASGRDPAVAVVGDLFGRFHVEAHAARSAAGALTAHGSLAFDKLVLEALVPELVALGDGRGIASGRLEVDIAPGRPLSADVLLTELSLSLARSIEAAPGEPVFRRVDVTATKPIHASILGDHVILDDMQLSTTGGDLHARGSLVGARLDAAMDGHLDLELLQPFLTGSVDKITGALDVGVTVGGTIEKPDLRGHLAVRDPVHVRPKGVDTDVVVVGGLITLDPAGAAVDKLAVTIDGATTQVDGRLKLGASFLPEAVDARIAGEISARFLATLAAGAVSDAQGRARIKAEVKGRIDNPTVTAWLGLGTITFRLRDTGTQVEVKSGVVEVTNSGALLRDVKVVLDDQGTLTIGAAGVRPGRLEIKKLVPFAVGAMDFPLHGEHLTYRSPGTFEINDLAFDLDMDGDMDDGFEMSGEVRVISGRYVQDFKLSNLVLSPRVNESSVRPFYEGKPLLEGLALDLNVRTLGDAFVVQNDIAPEIHIDVALHVGGTLARPVLAGEVRPTDGRFHIPVLRGDFDLVPNVNHVTFVETKSLADGETPEINIEAQNPVIDSSGAEHNVRMNIHGPVREMQIDLSTDDGLDRNQTALLLLTGRTSTTNSALTTQNPTVGANIGTGLDIAGQATRDTIASLMEPIIGDTFERAIGLQLRLTVGPDGFEGRLRKRISRYLNFQLDALWGFQGQSRQNGQLDFWIRDYFTASTGVQRLVISESQGPVATLPINARFELHWDYAIRR